MSDAFDELAALADGVQLTPGNHPTPSFAEHARRAPTRTHHGFSFHARAVRVWNGTRLLVGSDSVHPPQLAEGATSAEFRSAIDEGGRPRSTRGHGCGGFAEPGPDGRRACLETMYPGYALGDGDDLEWAMARGLSLAVDVSHLHIQKSRGVIGDATLRRVFDYLHIAEVHVSANDGKRDQHAPIDANTFGLEWARERERAGTPIVLECYMHRMSADERRRQVAAIKE